MEKNEELKEINENIIKTNEELENLRKIKNVFKTQRQIDQSKEDKRKQIITAIDMATMAGIAAAITLNVNHGNENIFKNYDLKPQYITEAIDNSDNPDTVVYSTDSKDLGKNQTLITFDTYDQWVPYEDHYKRNVVTYQVTADKALKEYYQKDINNISIEKLEDLNYAKINSYTEESFTINEKDLNRAPYIRMTSTYKGNLVEVKESKFENISGLAYTAIIWIFGTLITSIAIEEIEKALMKTKSAKKKHDQHFKEFYTVGEIDDTNIDTEIQLKLNYLSDLANRKAKIESSKQ